MTETEKERDELRMKLAAAESEKITLKGFLREAGNELCYRCGEYRNEHLGACNGCRWRYVKHGEMPT